MPGIAVLFKTSICELELLTGDQAACLIDVEQQQNSKTKESSFGSTFCFLFLYNSIQHLTTAQVTPAVKK